MNRLFAAARHYVDTVLHQGDFGDVDKARQELLDAAFEAAPLRFAERLHAGQTITLERHTLFHDAAHGLVERAEDGRPEWLSDLLNDARRHDSER